MTGSAKQSSFVTVKKAGLLRRYAPRNDDRTWFRDLAAHFSREF
jgi:hypothetical protein